MSTEPSTTWVCIEIPGQIGEALKPLQREGGSATNIVALTPHVGYALEKMGRDYRRPEDYHSEEDINTIGLNDLDILDQFCETVDAFLQDRWPLLRQHDIQPARTNRYYLKNLFNSVSIRASILRRILEEERAKRVLYFGTRPEPIARNLSFVRESVWSAVIPATAQSLGIFCEPLSQNTDTSVLASLRSARQVGFKFDIRRWTRRILGSSSVGSLNSVYAMAKSSTYRLTPHFGRNTKTPPMPTLLALEKNYSLGHLLRVIQARGRFNTLLWNVQKLDYPVNLGGTTNHSNGQSPDGLPTKHMLLEQGKQIWAEAKTLHNIRDLLKFSEVDCFPVMESRLQHFFEVEVPEIAQTFLTASSLLRSTRPFAIFASTMGDYGHQAVAAAAKKESVPFVVYRHGDSHAHVWMESQDAQGFGRRGMYVEHNELRQADHILAFGEGDVRFFEKNKTTSVQIVPVGSAALDDVKWRPPKSNRDALHRRWGLDPDKSTVMYVPTAMDGNTRVAPYRSRSPSRMFDMERKIVGVFEEFPHIQLVLKPVVSPFCHVSPIAQLVKDRRLTNVRVIPDPFRSLLPMGDMFISDYPSTSFLEMLTTDKPVLVCGHELPKKFNPGVWHPSILDMWKERVAYADDLDEFLELLRTHLKEERFGPVNSENTLLKLFGTHMDDGKSVDRAYAFVESLAGKNSQTTPQRRRPNS